MEHARPGALIFDCDGTLVDSAPLYTLAWTAGLALSQCTMDAQWYRDRYGLSEHVLMDEFEHMHGITLNREAVIACMRQTYLENLEILGDMPGMSEIVHREHGRVPLAVASGGSRMIVMASLEHLGLAPFFDAIVTLDDVGVPKPAPDLYLHAASRLGVPPESCLVFEDSDTGILAAQRAGMQTVDIRECCDPG